MVPFIGGATPTWPKHARVWHLYALPDLTLPENRRFTDLAQRHRDILAERFAHVVVPVAPQWLHATVAMVTTPQVPDLSPATLDRLFEELSSALRPLEPITVWAAPHVGRTGPGLDLAPDEGFAELAAATNTVLDRVLDQRSPYHPPAPHITTGYCHQDGDSGPVASALRASRPTRAPLTFEQVCLIQVAQDARAHTYTWAEPAALIPLRGR